MYNYLTQKEMAKIFFLIILFFMLLEYEWKKRKKISYACQILVSLSDTTILNYEQSLGDEDMERRGEEKELRFYITK